MPELFGKQYTKDDLLKRVGDISQIAGARLIELADGYERGVRAAEFRTGSGLEFTALIDRGLDISTASFNSQPLAWRSAITDKHPSYYDDKGFGWLRSFYGGLVVTCGMTYAGAPCADNGAQLGLHGRISNTPATNVYADGKWLDDGRYEMWVQGKMRESVVFGENMQMERRISAILGENKIRIHDKITNLGYHSTEHMHLYHINAGFPVIDNNSRLVAPIRNYIPRDAEAEIGKEFYREMSEPIHGYKEKVYYIDLGEDSDGYSAAAYINPLLNGGFGFYVKFPKKELPKFTEWKNMDERDYVAGLEPANCWVTGRADERKRGTLQFLEPGETREYHVEIGVLSGKSDVDAYEEMIGKME